MHKTVLRVLRVLLVHLLVLFCLYLGGCPVRLMMVSMHCTGRERFQAELWPIGTQLYGVEAWEHKKVG